MRTGGSSPPRASRDTVVVAGALAQRPGVGGHTWQFLQYLLGFRRLGYDVLFLDRLEPEMCVGEAGEPCPAERSTGLRYLVATMRRFGFEGSFALVYDRGRRFFGLPRERVLERVRRSALFLNVMGFFDDEEILGAAPRLAFLDTDPGFGQMWQALGLSELVRGHDAYVTIGENVGRPGCAIPTLGLEWVTTPQPVVLDAWPPQPDGEVGSFTSVGAWRGPYSPVEFEGRTYGLRVHEFRKLAELPRRSEQSFEAALDIHLDETRDLALLRANGWSLADPLKVAGDPTAYRRYIQRSKAELMVAKGIYVQSQSGWFSERSMCYLASARPVLAQDTGIGERYPTGEGLVAFSTLDEAVAGAEEVAGNYASHARAARSIAEEYFDSDRVLSRLLQRLGAA